MPEGRHPRFARKREAGDPGLFGLALRESLDPRRDLRSPEDDEAAPRYLNNFAQLRALRFFQWPR
jgi:hypothetical protein